MSEFDDLIEKSTRRAVEGNRRLLERWFDGELSRGIKVETFTTHVAQLDMDAENMRAEILRTQGEIEDLQQDLFTLLKDEIIRIRLAVSKLQCLDYLDSGKTCELPLLCQICQVKQLVIGSNK